MSKDTNVRMITLYDNEEVGEGRLALALRLLALAEVAVRFDAVIHYAPLQWLQKAAAGNNRTMFDFKSPRAMTKFILIEASLCFVGVNRMSSHLTEVQSVFNLLGID